jgi:hypothetical protein
MRILLTEHDQHQSDTTAEALRRHGHTVLRCTCSPELGDATLTAAGCCPLEAVDLVVDVHGDPARPVSQRERGAVCALSSDVPLVVVGESLPAELLGAVACAPEQRVAEALTNVEDRPPLTLEEQVRQSAEAASAVTGGADVRVTEVRTDVRYVVHVDLECRSGANVAGPIIAATRAVLAGHSPADDVEVVVHENRKRAKA